MQTDPQHQHLSYQHGLHLKALSPFVEENSPDRPGNVITIPHENMTLVTSTNQDQNHLPCIKQEKAKKKMETTGKAAGPDSKMDGVCKAKLAQPSKKISKNASSLSSQIPKKKSLIRKHWQAHEDLRLIELVEKHGLNWALISRDMGWSRTGKQIRDRYLNKLDPDISNKQWTQAEDDLLLELYKTHDRKWREISRNIPGRTEAMVKNRFYNRFRDVLKKNSVKESMAQDSNYPTAKSNRSDSALSERLTDDNPTEYLNWAPEKQFSGFGPMPIPYNTQNTQNFISPEDNSYFSSQCKLDSCLRADSRVNQSEPDRIEYDDVPFIDYDAQTSRRIDVEDDLETIVFDNKAAENKRVANEVVHSHQPNQQVHSYNNCHTYQQGYNLVPIVNFNTSVVNTSMRVPVFVSGFPMTRTQAFISGFPSLRNVLWNSLSSLQENIMWRGARK